LCDGVAGEYMPKVVKEVAIKHLDMSWNYCLLAEFIEADSLVWLIAKNLPTGYVKNLVKQ
jgi:hypothetical protein